MAKSLKRTGRGAHSGMRRAKRRRAGIVSATRTTSVIPRTLYPMLPAEMRFCLKTSVQVTVNIPAGVQNLAAVSLVIPNQFPGQLPEYFIPLMTLYSRSWVEKAEVITTVNNISNVLITWQACIASQTDAAQLAAGDAGGRIRGMANSKFGQLGPQTGGSDQATVRFVSDNIKAVGPGLYDNSYATASTAAFPPVFTFPNLANIPDAPIFYMNMINSDGAAAATFFATRQVNLHMVFSARHAASNVVA